MLRADSEQGKANVTNQQDVEITFPVGKECDIEQVKLSESICCVFILGSWRFKLKG